MITMMALTYLGEIWNELTLTAMIGQIWTLPFFISLVALNLATTNNWVIYAILVLLLIYPNGTSFPTPCLMCSLWFLLRSANVLTGYQPAHPIQVAWNSRNANSVRTRTVSAACYNMFVQAGAIIGANIYRTGTIHTPDQLTRKRTWTLLIVPRR